MCDRGSTAEMRMALLCQKEEGATQRNCLRASEQSTGSSMEEQHLLLVPSSGPSFTLRPHWLRFGVAKVSREAVQEWGAHNFVQNTATELGFYLPNTLEEFSYLP